MEDANTKASSEPIGRKDGNGDMEGLPAEGQTEFTDPAILAVGGMVPSTGSDYRYSRDDLLQLRKAPHSQRRPDFLDTAYYNNNGVWDPEPWHFNNKQADGGNENGRSNEQDVNHKQRRPGDPRERIRKEQDGIVLSPQRRSFNSGCFVPVREPLRANRAHSPLGGKSEAPHISGPHREPIAGGRRIGSGRILPWDYQEKPDADNDFGYRRERRDTDREERFERRSFNRDFEVAKEKERHMGRNNNNNNNNSGRYSNRRISNESREEEPEWFSSGPMSQNDTIELRGFDENEKLGKKKTAAQKKKLKEHQGNNNSQKKESVTAAAAEEEKKSARSSTPTLQDGKGDKNVDKNSPIPEEDASGDGPHVGSTQNDASFNFEDILKCETIPGLLSNGVESGDAAGSRFSRWFKREKSPPNKQHTEGSSRSSAQEQEHHNLIKNLLGDPFNEPTLAIPQPGDSESYFAPISPAATSGQHHQGKSGQNLMEMLQRGSKMSGPIHDIKGISGDAPGGGKILSLEELEATMMQGSEVGGNKHPNKPDEDLNAFRRFFPQSNSMNVNSNGPVGQQKPMSIMEMLSHSQQQDEAALMGQRMSNIPPHMASDMNFKLQQQVQQQQKQQAQLELLSKLMNATIAQQAARNSPLHEMGVSQSRELLNRPEAQAILQGLKRGDITPQHLYQQLANQAMQPRHRDLLHTILKTQVGSGGNAAAGIPHNSASPVPPLYPQQLRVSPLPPNAYCVSPILATSPNTLSVPALHQRIPSPRELQVHTQNIMQRALIKKKLEEQEENYRKKQAQQRGGSPAKTASPTPLAFTPTAVLRKMTADKDDGMKDSKIDGKLPQGRALTGMRAPIIPPPTQQSQQIAPQQPPNWTNQFPQQLKQPAGRPIVKANNNYQPPGQTSSTQHQQQQEQYFQQQRLLQQQQAQHRKNQQTFGANYASSQSQQFPQLSQQQLRAQHQNVRAQHQQQQGFSQQQPQPQSWAQQMLQGQGFDNRQVGRGGMDGDLSPTSNQLARWFSPDLLDRARRGKLPIIPSNAVTQHALSLEEVERQTTPVGHN